MAQENTQGQPSTQGTPPGELPVVGDKKLFTHTMKDDVARSKTDPAAFVKEMEAKRPFSQFIPPPPVPGTEAPTDKFREVIEPIPERDQPFALPETPAPAPAVPQFEVRIPEKRGGLSATTIILAVVLLLLIGGGAAGYWWFFMRAPQSEVIVQIPEKPAPAPQPIEPQPIPIPAPAPIPEPVPVPEPEPQPVIEPATTTPAVEPVATTTPVMEPVVPPPPPAPIPEPVPAPAPAPEVSAPEAVLALDRTVTIALSAADKNEALAKIQAENAKITDATTAIRYVFTVSDPAGLRYLSGNEALSLLGITVPESIRALASRTDVVGYRSEGTMRYGFASAIASKTQVRSAALAWEQTMLDDLTGLYIEKMYEKPATIAFSTNTYGSFYKRYLNIPAPDTSLDWAASNAHFVVATSKDMIYALLAKAGQPTK